MHRLNKINILIVEDEVLIAEDIKDICELAGYAVSKICYNPRQAISAITNHSFDLAILDINLESDMSGFDVAEFIRLQKLPLPFIFLTSYSDITTLHSAKECRPLAYITKPFRKEQLISAIEIGITKSSSQMNKNAIDVQQLTEREAEIAKMICDGWTNEEIAKKLFLSVNTIKYHIKKIYEKLQVSNRIQLLKVMGI